MGCGPSSRPAAPGITKEFLWDLCAPFVERMLAEIERRVENQLQTSERCAHCCASQGDDRQNPHKAAPQVALGRKSFGFDGDDGSTKCASDDSRSTAECSEADECTFSLTPTLAAVAAKLEVDSGADDAEASVQEASNVVLAATADEINAPTKIVQPSVEQGLCALVAQNAEARSRPVLLGTEGRGRVMKCANKSCQQIPNGGKTSTMICHHWKSKGWCRLGAECKFMHPEEKRGVSFIQKARGRAGKNVENFRCDVDSACCPSNFVAFSTGGAFSALPMSGMPSLISPASSSHGCFFLTPGF